LKERNKHWKKAYPGKGGGKVRNCGASCVNGR
jgi:hypothetical protein